MAIHTMSHAGRQKASSSVKKQANDLFNKQIPRKQHKISFFKKKLMAGETMAALLEQYCVKKQDN